MRTQAKPPPTIRPYGFTECLHPHGRLPIFQSYTLLEKLFNHEEHPRTIALRGGESSQRNLEKSEIILMLFWVFLAQDYSTTA